MESEGFAKAIVDRETDKILGFHIIGPYAPILMQEVINAMNTADGTVDSIHKAMYIHPAVPEVVQRAFYNLRRPGHAHEHR